MDIKLPSLVILSTALVACNSGGSDQDVSTSVGDFDRNLTMDLTDEDVQETIGIYIVSDLGVNFSLSLAGFYDEDSAESTLPIKMITKSLRTTYSEDDEINCDSGSYIFSLYGSVADDNSSGDITLKSSADHCQLSSSGSGDNYSYTGISEADSNVVAAITWTMADDEVTALSSKVTGDMESAYVYNSVYEGESYTSGTLLKWSDLNSSSVLSGDYIETTTSYALYRESYDIYDSGETREGGSITVKTLEKLLYSVTDIGNGDAYPVDGKIKVTTGDTSAIYEFATTDYTVTVNGVSNLYEYD